MKNLATTALVSTNIVKSIVESIVDTLFDSGMEKVVNDTSSSLDGKDKVFLNGEWVGVCEDSLFFAAELRRKRRRKELTYQVIPIHFIDFIAFEFLHFEILYVRLLVH